MSNDLEKVSESPDQQLIACIEDSIGLFLFENACFMAERLMAQRPDDQSKALLATCYMHCGQHYRVPALLRNCTDPHCRYLLAKCLMTLPGKSHEAREVLMPRNDKTQVPNGAAGFYLLGRISRLTGRPREAAKFFSEALTLDPLLWSAYEELCAVDTAEAESWLQVGKGQTDPLGSARMPPTPGGFPGFPVASGRQRTTSRQLFGAGGGDHNHSTISPVTPGKSRAHNRFAAAAASTAQRLPPQQRLIPPSFDTASPTVPRNQFGGFARHHTDGLGAKDMGTPSLGPPLQTGRALFFETPPAMAELSQPPVIPPRGAAGVAAGAALRQGSVQPTPRPPNQGAQPSDIPTPLAAGGQKGGSRYNLRAPPTRQHGSTNGKVFVAMLDTPSASRPHVRVDIPSSPTTEATSAERQVLEMLQFCGAAVRHLAAFRCQDAMAALEQLPKCHQKTGWWWCQLAKAHFASVEYPAAADAFLKARQMDTTRLQDMEIFSTVLWHLKRDVQLSHLAQEALALDRLSPATCCILGNFFSLQKEHENALRFCQRALQLDATFEYAYTLCGHEYFANEDFQQGLDCYRHAIRLDPRHYQAWYGIGQIHYRQEQFVEAEHHFRRAAAINRRSSVLQCYVGMALAKQGREAEALQRLQDATKLDAKNPLARFERAALLENIGRLGEALHELSVLRDMLPRDGSVHFKIGRVCRRLNQLDEAVQAFSTALALNPSAHDAAMIKSALERMQSGGGDEEMS